MECIFSDFLESRYSVGPPFTFPDSNRGPRSSDTEHAEFPRSHFPLTQPFFHSCLLWRTLLTKDVSGKSPFGGVGHCIILGLPHWATSSDLVYFDTRSSKLLSCPEWAWLCGPLTSMSQSAGIAQLISSNFKVSWFTALTPSSTLILLCHSFQVLGHWYL